MSAEQAAALDWERLANLRLRATQLVDGLYTGAHRSIRRGGGVEFAEHRNYTPGDDLRRLDVRAFLRHGRLLVRQFETDTQRSIFLVVDASASMQYKSREELPTKLAYAELLAAGLSRLALAEGDFMALSFLGGLGTQPVPAAGGKMAFERLLVALDSAQPSDEGFDTQALERSVLPLVSRAKRGSSVVILTDAVDLPDGALNAFCTLCSERRDVAVVQVLDPRERRFDFSGALRLKPAFGANLIETDAASARSGYLKALAALQARYQNELRQRRGSFISCDTEEEPLTVLRRIIDALQGRSLGDAKP